MTELDKARNIINQTDEEMAIVQSMIKDLEDYHALRKQVISLDESGKGVDAYLLLHGEAAPLADKIVTEAEQLLAMGDMLFTEGGRSPVRIHGAFISDKELQKIGDFLRSQGEPEYIDGVTSDAGEDVGGMVGQPSAIGGSGGGGDKDADLYARAKEFVIRDKKPTISYLQRRLQIGYNKAAGFMERMEEEGIVSGPDANNKRHIL